MNRAEIVDVLRSLTHKQVVEVFYEAVAGRFIYAGEESLWDAHLVLANAVRDRGDANRTWRLELLCPTPGQTWEDDAMICHHGEHCGPVRRDDARGKSPHACDVGTKAADERGGATETNARGLRSAASQRM
jgi:hypothetical protein